MTERLQKQLGQTVSSGQLVSTKLPLCPELSLLLLSDDYPRGPLPHEEMLAVIKRPAYWAFCWASGQVLARHLMQNPSICAGKSILDFGAGSGVVAVAAALSGASQVIACDLDDHALIACEENARLNGVSVTLLPDLNDLKDPVDLLIAADVLYDRENLEWLDRLSDYASAVLIADSRIRDPAVFEGYDLIDTVTATTIPDLDEMKEFGNVSIYFRQFPQGDKRQTAPN